MLSNKPTDNSVAASSTPAMIPAPSSAELDAPVVPSEAENDVLHEIAAMLGESTASSALDNLTHLGPAFTASSPEFRDQDSFDTFMTSPLMPDLDQDYGYSPNDTPFHDFLNTPLITDDALITSPYLDDMPLFPDYPMEEAVSSKTQTDFLDAPLYTISPSSPMLDSFDTSLFTPARNTSVPASTSSSTSARRPSRATGIRKGITPEALLDESAPTQPRKYATPSATSKKELPATFARKRARSTAFGDEEDQLPEDLPLNPTEKDLIEAKRRQNTVAARRSRKRKLEQFQTLERAVEVERGEKEMWKERATMLLEVIRNMGVVYPDFPSE